MDDFLSEIHDDLQLDGGAKHIKPLFHCPNHNKSEMDMATSAYIHDVKTKVEAKKEELKEIKSLF